MPAHYNKYIVVHIRKYACVHGKGKRHKFRSTRRALNFSENCEENPQNNHIINPQTMLRR